MSENEKLVAVSDNGKRWRVVPEDNDWEMVVVGHVTAGQAEKICRRIAEQAAALTAAEARIKMLSEALAEKQAAIDAAYPAMKRALRLGQIDMSKVEFADESPERRKLRLDVFRALDMPTACLSGHVSGARTLTEAGRD